MDNQPLATIIMPAYNGGKYIAQAIESVLNQEYSNWELIVVDDGSTDKTADIVNMFTDSRIFYNYKKNGGQASALNQGLDLSKGDYISTLDVDDWFTAEHLIERVSFLENHPEYGVVYGNGYYCDLEGNPLKLFSENRIGDVIGDVYGTLITTPFFATGANVLVRRQVFEEHSIRYDESIVWCQDWDIYIRIADVAKFGLVDGKTLWYRLHENNMTMSLPQGRRHESLVRTKNKVLASPRFSTVSVQLKCDFYYQFITEDLHGQIIEQNQLLESEDFGRLPKAEQARLLRITANNYLLKGKNLEFTRSCLRKAWRLAPFDLKTLLNTILVSFNVRFVRFVVQKWRQFQNQPKASPSLIEMAKK